jgi:hypothetical protein
MPGTLALLLALAAPPAPAPFPAPCAATPGPAEIDVPPGTRLRAAPDPAALSLAVVDAAVTLAASSRCGDWAEVRWGGFRGWVLPGDTAGPELETGARAADAARLSRARSAMRRPAREARLGPWRLVTDVAPADLPGLDAVASHVAETFAARTGLAAVPGADQAVVIFSGAAHYRAFAEADGSPIPWIPGHAGAGLAAFALGRNPLETRLLLVHELTHLLTQNSLHQKTPAWLAEGLAEDLAWCRVDATGRLQPDTLDLHVESNSDLGTTVVRKSGPRMTVDVWLPRARAGRTPPLTALLSPASALFADPAERRDAATTSTQLIRWCLSDPARAAAFREFLVAVSLGGAADENALAATLGLDVPGLEKAFREHLRGL